MPERAGWHENDRFRAG